MPQKKRIPKKKQAWLNIVNRAVQLNIRPVISTTKHIRYVRTNLGRVDLERHGALTDAGREWHRRTWTAFRAAQTIPKADYENANVKYLNDYAIRGTAGWDPGGLGQRRRDVKQ